MTDYEILSLFSEFGANTQTVFMNYVTVLSAFLIAGFLVADRLSKTMTIVLVALFSVVAFQQGTALLLHWGDQVGLMADIRGREALGWHGSARVGPLIGALFNITYFVAVIGGYVGALVFFFSRRRAKSVAE